MRRSGLTFFFLLVAGCAPKTPEATIQAMRERACAGDVAGFFAPIDKEQVTESLGEIAGGKELRPEGKGSLRERLGVQIAASMRPEMARAIFGEWEKQVRRGKEGELCRMELVETRVSPNSATVRWKTPSGTERVFALDRVDERWKVTGLR